MLLFHRKHCHRYHHGASHNYIMPWCRGRQFLMRWLAQVWFLWPKLWRRLWSCKTQMPEDLRILHINI